MNEIIAYLLLFGTLGIFAYIGYNSGAGKNIGDDEYLSARGTQNSLRIALSLFASGMGVWILIGPSELGYYGGFWEVTGYAVSAATPFLLLAYIGPMIRNQLPTGVTLADYVKMKLGRPMQLYVGIISVLYMFTFLFAEFTAIGKGMEYLTDMKPMIPMMAVAIVTAAYTSFGGLPASLRTDKVQAGVILVLISVLLVILFGSDISELIKDAKAYNPAGYDASWSNGSITYMDTFKSGLAIVLAITAAEMFSQGNWQRTWASKDDKSLKKGALIASALVLPLVFVMGFFGTVAAGRGIVDDPSLAFFTLIGDNNIILWAFVVLILALVCSSVDTLLNAISASITRDISDSRMGLSHARIVTIAMVPMAIYLATGPTIAGFTFDAWSVFGIFLIADLLAAATIAPILLTLWKGVSSKGALIGAFSGILSVGAYGMLDGKYFLYLLHPTIDALPASDGGLTNLWVFVAALLGSTIVTVLASSMLPDDPESIFSDIKKSSLPQSDNEE